MGTVTRTPTFGAGSGASRAGTGGTAADSAAPAAPAAGAGAGVGAAGGGGNSGGGVSDTSGSVLSSQVAGSQVSDGRVPDGRVPDGQVPSSRVPDGRVACGQGVGGEGCRHSLSVLVSRMRARLAGELPAGLWSMPDGELAEVLVGLQGLVAQVEAVSLAVVREVDRRDLGRTAGATSTANWISGLLRMRPGQANRRVTLARDLDSSLAQTQTALEAGSIGVEAADIIAQTIRDLHPAAGPQVRIEAERVMLDHARTFDPRDLLRIGKTILHTVDPELADQILATQLAADEQRADRARDLSISDDPYTTASFIRGKLDPITTDMLRTALEPLAKPRPTDADGPDTRSPGQRLGDGLHELLRRYLDSGASPTHGGEKPHLIIRIDADHLTHHTGYAMLTRTNTPISTHTATRLACDATITYWPTNPPPATDPPRGADPSSTTNPDPGAGTLRGAAGGDHALTDPVRLFTGKTRRLLELRDQGCTFPGCDRPPSWCEGHHIVSWLQGGPTTINNGVLLCRHHHRLIHQHTWHIRLAADGHPEFIPPQWIDPRQKPQRNNTLRM